MIEIDNVISCISKECDNISKLNKLKSITYLSNETIIDKKVNNKYVNENIVNNFNKKIYSKKIFFNKSPNQNKNIIKVKYYNYLNANERSYLIRNNKIKKYKKINEQFKNNMKIRKKKYEKIINSMYEKMKKISYLKNNKIKL